MFGFQRVTPTAPSYIRFRPVSSEVLIACCHLPVGVCIYQVRWVRWAMMSWAGYEVDFICGIQLDFNVGWRPGYTSKNFFGRGSKQYLWTPKLAVMILFVLSLCSLWSRYWHGLVFVGSSLSKCLLLNCHFTCSTFIIHSLSKPGRTSPLCLRVTYCNPENHESWHTQAFWGQGP